MISDAVQRLLHRLDLAQGETGEASTTWHGEAGANALNLSNRLFGGMVVAQTIVAAGRTHTERTVHSVQTVFLRGGRADAPLRYRVERVFDGRTYASVRVEVRQDDHVISQSLVGVTAGIDGPDRSDVRPAAIALDATVNRDEFRNRPNWQDQPIECRVDADTLNDGEAALQCWIRPYGGELPTDPLLHQAVLGYASDRAFMSVAIKPHGAHGDFKSSTLDHSIWFHRPLRFDAWHLYDMMSPTIAGGRGLVQGAIYGPDSQRVATTTQQGTFRPVTD